MMPAMRRAFMFSVLWLAILLPVCGREVPITILHTTDLHGTILPTTDYEGNTDVGGLVRCATAIARVRAEQPNTLLVDAGDLFQGTPVSWLTDGKVMVKALNALRYDAWVIGNHEFDWGLAKLTGCVALAQMPVLAANMEGLPGIESFVIREVEGVKVGIVGLTTPAIPSWSRPRLIAGLRFIDSVTVLKELLPAVRKAGAAVLVLVAHQGYRESGDDHANQIVAIARAFPEIDVIIGAHTHRDFPEQKVAGVLYTQAAYYGIRLGRVDLVFDTEKRMVTRRTARTLTMDGSIPFDTNLLVAVSGELAAADKYAAEVVGTATAAFELRGAPKRETPVHELLCVAIAESLAARGVAVDGVLHGVLSAKSELAKGPVTMADIWRVVPFENFIGVAELSVAELTAILDENAGVFEKKEFRGFWGLRTVIDPKAAAGKRVLSLRRADGAELAAEARLRVAFNSYDLASAGRRCPKLREIVDRPTSRLVELELTTREALTEYMRRHVQISPSVREWWETPPVR